MRQCDEEASFCSGTCGTFRCPHAVQNKILLKEEKKTKLKEDLP